MKLASESYELKSRADLCLLLGKLPSELTPDKISREEVFFLLNCHKKSENERIKSILDDLGFMLGTTWSVDDAVKINTTHTHQDKVYLPLALSIALSGMSSKGVLKTVEDMKAKARAENSGMTSSLDNANSLSRKEYLALFGRNNRK